MRKWPRRPRGWPIAFGAASCAAGVLVGWLMRGYGAPAPAGVGPPPLDSPIVSDASRARPAGIAPDEPRVEQTAGARRSDLRLPIDGMTLESMKGGFEERRTGHPHEAVDILAPRNTPVHAVEDGTIAKLFYSKGGGGNTIYQFDPEGRLCFYYAHLERYTDGLRDGQPVAKGDVIGYVGTSGNAPPTTPHLHFAVFQLDASRQWWKGQAIDPYRVFSGTPATR